MRHARGTARVPCHVVAEVRVATFVRRQAKNQKVVAAVVATVCHPQRMAFNIVTGVGYLVARHVKIGAVEEQARGR